MPRDPTETFCEHCGEGPECAVCGRGRPATVAAPPIDEGRVRQLMDAARRFAAGLTREEAVARLAVILGVSEIAPG